MKNLYLAIMMMMMMFTPTSSAEDSRDVEKYVAEFRVAFPGVDFESDDLIEITTNPKVLPYLPSTALCKYNRSGPNKIYINTSWWEGDVNIWYRRKVMFHELGHCILNLRHNNSYHSIMNIKLDTVDTDGSNWDDLVLELQNRYRIRNEN